MTWQRTIGVDLALQGTHKAAGCNEKADFMQKNPFHFNSTQEEFESLVNRFVPPGISPSSVAFAMEPTCNVWRPLSAFLIGRGFNVFLVKTQKVSDLRKYYKKYTKSDFKDAQTMARLPLIDKDSLNKLELPQKELYTLDRINRQYTKLGDEIAKCKNRIQAIFQLLNPYLLNLLGDNKFNSLGRDLISKFANPFKIKKSGLDRFKKELAKNANGHINLDVVDSLYNVSMKHCELLQDIEKNMKREPFDLDALQDELNLELKHIEFLEKQRKQLKEKIDMIYKKLDPHKVLTSFMGIGDIIAPVILTALGNLSRFPNIRKVKAFLGFVPRKKQTSLTDKKGLKIIKAASNIFKEHMYLAAETARQFDVQFADRYNRLMKRGKHHKQAICALANMMIARIFSVLKRYYKALNEGNTALAQTIKYELRDVRGYRITASEAREIILRDYPSKKEQERRRKQEKEKNATAFNTRQSLNSSKGRFMQSSPVVLKEIIPQVLEAIK